MIVNIINKLFEHSNHHIELRYDKNLPIPGFSFVEKNIYGQFIPIIVINLDLIPNNDSILAHVLSHEWGHHVLKHIKLIPIKETKEEINKKEIEADKYAASFCKKYNYNIDDIEKFLNQHPCDDLDRIKILRDELRE